MKRVISVISVILVIALVSPGVVREGSMTEMTEMKEMTLFGGALELETKIKD